MGQSSPNLELEPRKPSHTTFDLPDYDHSYDIPGTDLQVSTLINGSSTMGSGVPVIDTGNEGFTLVDPPSVEELVVNYNRPNDRHYLGKVNQKSVAKDINTVIEPGVDVGADVAAINAGNATRTGDRYVVNGRTYGYHSNGTLYPISGSGLHQLNRPSYKALGVYNQFGNSSRAAEILDNMGISKTDRSSAIDVWQLGQTQ